MIKAKIEYIIRVLGLLLITLAIPFTFISDCILIEYLILGIFYFVIIIPWVIFYIIWKLTISIINNRVKIILILLITLSSFFCLVPLFLINNNIHLNDYVIWLFQIIKIFTILLSWNFCFSIYKKRKVITLLFGIFYCILNIFFLIFLSKIWFWVIISLVFFLSGIFCIFFGEYLMFKKGLLKYL